MATGLLHLHNILRWVLLILLLVTVIQSYSGWQKKKALTPGNNKLWLFTMVTTHINLLVGLYLLFFGTIGILQYDLPSDVKIMEVPALRFFWIEHPSLMLIATVLITLGRGMAKKAVPDVTKYRKAFWFFFIALLLILAAIPWPFREVARPLFPGMGS